MNRRIITVLFTLQTLFAADVQHGNFGAEAPPLSQQKSASHSKHLTYPFFGEIQSHDSATLTLKGKRKVRRLLITPETRILKNGSPAKIDDAAVGTHVSGSARKTADGKEEAIKITLK